MQSAYTLRVSRVRANPIVSREVRFLRRARSYPHRARTVQVVETHFAWVFLVGRYAYKLKKPLRRGAMNYRSIASRARACRSELRLNLRLAPRVYLDVVPLGSFPDGSLALGRRQRIVDWLVRMHRLPASRMLDKSIARGRVSARDRRAIIELLTQFYAQARRRPLDADRYRRLLRVDLEQCALALCDPDLGLDCAAVRRVMADQQRYLDENPDLIGARAAHLIDAHGDLRPEHVFLGTQAHAACVIDCLEFSAELRRLDPIEELAFLALECRRLGGEGIGRSLLQGVRSAMGDAAPDALIDFYESRRALTRAKLAAWHLRDSPSRRQAAHWTTRAEEYLRIAGELAHRALRRRGLRPAPRAGTGPRGTQEYGCGGAVLPAH